MTLQDEVRKNRYSSWLTTVSRLRDARVKGTTSGDLPQRNDPIVRHARFLAVNVVQFHILQFVVLSIIACIGIIPEILSESPIFNPVTR